MTHFKGRTHLESWWEGGRPAGGCGFAFSYVYSNTYHNHFDEEGVCPCDDEMILIGRSIVEATENRHPVGRLVHQHLCQRTVQWE